MTIWSLKMNIKPRKQSEIRVQSLKDPIRVSMMIEKETIARLKERAIALNTTYGEILRCLINEYLNGGRDDA